jgi:ABC-type lipoprotein export system ATPase subunit
VRAVSKTYGRGDGAIGALRDVGFEIGAGEVALLVGPSGSGKTTLLNLLAALDRPDCGSINVSGSEVQRLSFSAAAKYRSRQVGIIFQAYNLLPQLSALENVMLPMVAMGRPDRQRAMELLSAVGLRDRMAHRAPELSGGEQQRVAIARTLANDPSLILADEPTGNLDEANARSVIALLCNLQRGKGTTLIIATHNRGIIPMADSVLELRTGFLKRLPDEGPQHASAASR